MVESLLGDFWVSGGKDGLALHRRDLPYPGKYIIKLKLTKYSRWKLSGCVVCDLWQLELTVSRGQFGRLCRQVYRKVSKQESMQVSKLVCKKVGVTKFTGLLVSGYVMIVGNYQWNAANQSNTQFQLELSLAQFSPSLFYFIYWLGQNLSDSYEQF